MTKRPVTKAGAVNDHAIHDYEKGQLKSSNPLEIVTSENGQHEDGKGNRNEPTRTSIGPHRPTAVDRKEKVGPQACLT